MSTKKRAPPKFRIGDKVRHTASSWGEGIDVICEITRCQGTWQYATTRQGAWFTSSDFVLVRRGNSKTMAEVDRTLNSDEEGEEGEDWEVMK